MYRAAEMAVFDRTGSDVLLIALDTKGTEAGARSATRAAIKAGADVILTGATRFAYLGPDSAYGRRVKTAYADKVKANDGEMTASESYQGNDISVMQLPAQRIAAFYAEGEALAKANEGITPMSFETILLPEGGTALRSLAPLLPYYEVDPARVQFLGTSKWADPDTVREPALNGGIFAGPSFDADGKPERGLAIYQIVNGRFVVIDPAPRSVQGGS